MVGTSASPCPGRRSTTTPTAEAPGPLRVLQEGRDPDEPSAAWPVKRAEIRAMSWHRSGRRAARGPLRAAYRKAHFNAALRGPLAARRTVVRLRLSGPRCGGSRDVAAATVLGQGSAVRRRSGWRRGRSRRRQRPDGRSPGPPRAGLTAEFQPRRSCARPGARWGGRVHGRPQGDRRMRALTRRWAWRSKPRARHEAAVR